MRGLDDDPDCAELALVALIAATGPTQAGHALCARLLDLAAEDLLSPGAPIDVTPQARRSAAAVLARLCAACGQCPRGLTIGPVMASPPHLDRRRLRR